VKELNSIIDDKVRADSILWYVTVKYVTISFTIMFLAMIGTCNFESNQDREQMKYYQGKASNCEVQTVPDANQRDVVHEECLRQVEVLGRRIIQMKESRGK